MSSFSVLKSHVVEFQQLAMSKPELSKSQDVFNRVMIKDNIAIFALFEDKQSHQRILVGNAHLHWDPQYKDVKLIQTAMLMEELETLVKGESHSDQLQIILCGDFNSLPSSGVFEFLSQGRIPQNHDDFGNYSYGNYTLKGLSHSLSLKSSYSHMQELPFTNYTPIFKGVIDYVWYSTFSLTVTALLGAIEQSYVDRCVGFPNWHHPSDHIPLLVTFKPRSNTNSATASSFPSDAAFSSFIMNDNYKNKKS
jgi:CCR4-NOT transcription complex subunit 6